LDTAYYPNGQDVFAARQRDDYKSTVLVIDHYVPEFDKDAGSRSTFQYLRLLTRKGARVVFLPDNFLKLEPYTAALQRLGIEVLYGDRYALNWRTWWKENGRFFDVAYLHRPHIASRYIDEISANADVKTIYFGHDLHYLRTKREYDVTKQDDLLHEINKWQKLEHYVIRRSDVVYYPSPVEVQSVLQEFPDKCVKQIPLYITSPLGESTPDFEDREGILFVGGFRHPPNLDGVNWFVNEVFPLVVDALPSITFFVVGSRMPDDINGLNGDNVVVKGAVSDTDLDNLYSRVRLVVVPLRFGAGVKGKVLEAMRYKVPVVTTTVGSEGLPEPEIYLTIADSAEDFAREVRHLYTDSGRWSTLVRNGERILETYFSEQAAFEVIRDDFGLGSKSSSKN